MVGGEGGGGGGEKEEWEDETINQEELFSFSFFKRKECGIQFQCLFSHLIQVLPRIGSLTGGFFGDWFGLGWDGRYTDRNMVEWPCGGGTVGVGICIMGFAR